MLHIFASILFFIKHILHNVIRDNGLLAFNTFTSARGVFSAISHLFPSFQGHTETNFPIILSLEFLHFIATPAYFAFIFSCRESQTFCIYLTSMLALPRIAICHEEPFQALITLDSIVLIKHLTFLIYPLVEFIFLSSTSIIE